MRSAAVDAAANIALTQPTGQRLQKKLAHASKRFIDLARVFARTLRVVRSATALSADDRRDLLDQLVRLELRCQLFRHGGDQRDAALKCTRQKDRSAEMRFQRVDNA